MKNRQHTYFGELDRLGPGVILVGARDKCPEKHIKDLARVASHCPAKAPNKGKEEQTLQPECNLHVGK